MLASERCQVCRPGTPTLDRDEAGALATEIDAAWDVGDERLRRRVGTADFAEALALAVRVGMLAEQEGHHPDLHVHWGRLVVDITTHAAGGLTRNDFILAAKIDGLLGAARSDTTDTS